MILNASNSITLLPRPRQQLLTFDFIANGRQLFRGTDGLGDEGLDFVSVDGTIAFSRVPTPSPTSGAWSASNPRAQFATITGNVGLPSVPGSDSTLDGFGLRQFDRQGSVQQAGGGPAIVRYSEGTGTSAVSFVLDLKASGPTAVDPATGVARAIPRDSRINAVGREPSIDPSTRDALRQIQLDPRDPTTQEFAQLLLGSATYDDSGKAGTGGAGGGGRIAAADQLSVVINRLPRVPTEEFIRKLQEVFPPGTGRDKEVRAALTESVKRFRDANNKVRVVEPTAFRAYLETTEGETASLSYVREVGELFDQLHTLGLTPGEERRVRGFVLRRIQPPGFQRLSDFEQVFRTDMTAMR
jgi:hypothetical protein